MFKHIVGLALVAFVVSLAAGAQLPSVVAPEQSLPTLSSDFAPGVPVLPQDAASPEPAGLDAVTWYSVATFTGTAKYRCMGAVQPDSGILYVAGGQTTAPLAEFHRYSSRTNTWTTMTSMPGINANQCAVWWTDPGTGTDSSCFIILGRYTPTYFLTSYRWTRATNTWDTIPWYPEASAYTGNMAAVVGDSIFLICRTVASGGVNTACYRYSIRQGTWAARATPAINTNYYGASCAYGGKVYQLGGWSASTGFQVYNPATGVWTTLNSCPSSVGGNSPHIVGMGGNIVAYGGGNGWSGYTGVALFDTVSKTWTTDASTLPNPWLAGAYGPCDSLGTVGAHVACGYNGTSYLATHYRGVLPPSGFTNDVGVQIIRTPKSGVDPGVPVAPRIIVRNFGTAAQSNIPVRCRIDSAGTTIYNQTGTITGPVAAGASDSVTLATSWTPGNGPVYAVKCSTYHTGDQYAGNDALSKNVTLWVEIAQPADSVDRLAHATVYNPVNDRMYIIGGQRDGSTTRYNFCHEYNPTTDAWTRKADMTTVRAWVKGSCVKGKIYVIGGVNASGTTLATNECFDPVANSWSSKTSRPNVCAADLEVVWRDSLIYCLGAWNGSTTTPLVDIYRPGDNTWSTGTNLPMQADMGGAVCIGDTIYIVNALNRGASNLWTNIYKGAINPANPAQITWTMGPALVEPVCITGAAALGGDIYWIGGLKADLVSWSKKVYKYTPATGTVTSIVNDYPDIIARHHFFAGRPSQNELYCLAGDSLCNWNTPNRMYRRIRLGPPAVHDVGAKVITAPSGTVMVGTVVTPACSVYNYGNQTESYYTKLTVGTYRDSFLVSGHAAGTAMAVTLPSTWTATPSGTYPVDCWTALAGDATPANDTARGSVTVVAEPGGWSLKSLMPITPSGKYLQSGGWLAYDAGKARIYAAKGNKTGDFYAYDPSGDSWHTCNTWPPGTEAKLPKAGSVGCADGNGMVYATKGNNTQGFWKYDAIKDSWYQKKDVPLGSTGKKVKGGTDVAYTQKDANAYVYMLKGYKNEFWRYDVAGDSWSAMKDAPIGANLKYDKGSWLALDGGANVIYAHKAKYHEFYKYFVVGDSWSATALKAMPIPSKLGTSKKSKEGGAGSFLSGKVYAFKGGNTIEWWRYYTSGDSWQELDTIPSLSAGKKKKVKAGADVVTVDQALYATKGNKCNDLWKYRPGGLFGVIPDAHDGVLAEQLGSHTASVALSPNPLASGFATLKYSLARAGLARVSVFDVTGRSVFAHTLALGRAGTTTLDLRKLSAGVYLVKLATDDFSATQKLVVQH